MSNKKILIVDDHGALRYILTIDLKKNGFDTIIASDGKQGIEIALSEQPDLILLDAMMPVMDGYEACEILTKSPETSHIPIIMLTAQSKRSEIQRGLEAGAKHYLIKPFNFEELYQKIIELIGEPHSTQ